MAECCIACACYTLLTFHYYFFTSVLCTLIFFFFQAEDGIRDYKVTGVQTCALPICRSGEPSREARRRGGWRGASAQPRRTCRGAAPRPRSVRGSRYSSSASPDRAPPDRKSVV